MIYSFKITSSDKPEFICIIEINPEESFLTLHSTIQQCANFDSDQLASFFLSDDRWGRKNEIGLLNEPNGTQRYLMNKTKIKNLIKAPYQKLLYVFDFFNDRMFYVELTGIIMDRNLNEPQIAFMEGKAPKQILSDDVDFLNSQDSRLFENYHDFGDLDDYTEIFGEMDDLIQGGN